MYMAKTTNSETFENDISTGVVLMDFWAGWCGPCKMLAPTIEELEKEYEGRVTVCKADVDECPDLATSLGIYSIPTVLIYKDGEKKEQVIGYHLKREYVALLDKYL